MLSGEKAKDFKGTIRKLIVYLGNFRFAILGAIVITIGATVFNVLGPKVLGTATTTLVAGVTAKVQGSRPAPYAVSVDFRIPEGEPRLRIVAALRAEPMLVARLLADDLPTEVVGIFAAEGYDVFPGGKLGPGRYDATTSCTCPDYANPCKHTAAVLLLLGEEVSRRPLTLLEFRGIFPEDLCDED